MPSPTREGQRPGETDRAYAERLGTELEAIRATARNERIAEAARKRGFIDGEDVIGKISVEDASSDYLLDQALQAIAEQSPHLLAPPAPELTATGVPVLTSVEEWAALPEDQQLARLGEAEALMRGEGPGGPTARQPLKSLDEWEALPQAERIARMDEADDLLKQGHH